MKYLSTLVLLSISSLTYGETPKPIPMPPKIQKIVDQLVEMSKKEEINFAFAFAYPDPQGNQWFEAHTGGTPAILKPFFAQDTNAAAEAQIRLTQQNPTQKIYFHIPPTLFQRNPKH